MKILVELIFITFLCVMGLKIVLSEEMLLERLGKWLQNKSDEGHKVFDLFICPWCMNSLQSITAHAFAFGLGILPLEFNWQLIIRWPLVVFGASFLSGNVWNIYETINSVREKNKNETEYFKFLNKENEAVILKNLDNEEQSEIQNN